MNNFLTILLIALAYHMPLQAQEQKEKVEIIQYCDNSSEPQFPSGTIALQQYMSNHIDYTCFENIEDLTMTSRIYYKFTVNADGSIEDIEVLTGKSTINDPCAKTFISDMPRWIPGTDMYGNPVQLQVFFPLTICLK